MDEEFEKRHKEVPWLKQKPSEYTATAPLTSEWSGGEAYPAGCETRRQKLMYASDYPHWDSDWPNTVRTVVERDDVDDTLRQKIMCDNALSLRLKQARAATAS